MYDKKLLGYVVPEYGLERKKNSDSSAPPQKKFCIAMIEKSVFLLQSTLPNPNGTPKYDNLADLERLLKEIGNGYIMGIRANMRVPFALQAKLRTDMMSVNDAISADLANLAETSFADDIIPGELWERAAPMLQRGAKDFSGAVGENDRSFHRYLALKDLERIGYGQFLYVSENAAATCDVCAAQHGKTYSMREMEASGKIPPVHSNCKCSLVALDTAAKNSYNLNRQSFIEDVERRLLGRSGGIYRSAQDFARGGLSLSPVRVSTEPIISDGGAGSNWYDGLRDWAVDFGTDAKAAWDAFCYGFAERDKNKLNDLPSFLDWLTSGIVSGAFAANAGRYEEAFRDPTFYNIANFVSLGTVGTINGAVNPEKPLSFAHWMSSLETVMLAYSAYKTVEQAAALRAAPAPQRTISGDLERAGLSPRKAKKILKTPKGQRPDPSTYLKAEYIKNHLSEFEDGVTKIMSTAPTGTVGPRGGGFVMSSKTADELIELANGDIAKLENLLGIDRGYLGSSPVRVDIASPSGLRMPGGNEKGANKFWKPGGYTSGGIKEAVIDPAPVGTYDIKNIF